jgi:hypothetical protein
MKTTQSLSLLALVTLCLGTSMGQEQPREDVQQALLKAVDFFHQHVAVEGGYVYLVSSDLKYREGEGVADAKTVWVQPPGTPAVGSALLEAYRRTREPKLLQAAKDAGYCLVRGQLQSGGWQDHIDFSPELRPKLAYRVESKPNKKARNLSTFDDDKTQSAIRFLSELDQTLEFKDAKIHNCVEFALESVLKNQHPNGGFGQVYESLGPSHHSPTQRAKFPTDWAREYPGGDYWFFYTINDNNISKVIDTLLLAASVYRQPRYRDAAIKAADFLLLAQMPEPQPAWAQQYNFEMEPVWARKFEPPAISGSESQNVIESLMDIYLQTGDRKYLAPIPRALTYLQESQLPNGRLARFYELQTNKPLFFTKDYKLTYSSESMPTHYSFIVANSTSKLRNKYEKLSQLSDNQLQARRELAFGPSNPERPSADLVRQVITSMDDRGAWVESGKLQYHKGRDDVNQIIRSETFIRNIGLLSAFLHAKQ